MKLHQKIRMYTKKLSRVSVCILASSFFIASCGTNTKQCQEYGSQIQKRSASVQDCVDQVRMIAGPILDMWKADPEPLSYTELHLRLDKDMIAVIYHDPVPRASTGDVPLERVYSKKVSQVVFSRIVNTLEVCSDTVRLPR